MVILFLEKYHNTKLCQVTINSDTDLVIYKKLDLQAIYIWQNEKKQYWNWIQKFLMAYNGSGIALLKIFI